MAPCAAEIIEHAWRDLPAYDRHLLESIGASQWLITTEATGRAVDDLLRSAGYERLSERAFVTSTPRPASGSPSCGWSSSAPHTRLLLSSTTARMKRCLPASPGTNGHTRCPSCGPHERTSRPDNASLTSRRLAYATSSAVAATVVRSTRMNSSLRSTLCSCRAGVAVKPGSRRGFTTRSTTLSGG